VRILRLLLVTVLIAACSSGLTDAQWVWCQANRDAVKQAAGTLGLVVSGPDVQRCIGSDDIESCINHDVDYIKACRAINAKYGGPPPGASDVVSDDETTFCDGASIAFGGTHPDNAPRVSEYQFRRASPLSRMPSTATPRGSCAGSKARRYEPRASTGAPVAPPLERRTDRARRGPVPAR
jgi:hypothetical protein